MSPPQNHKAEPVYKTLIYVIRRHKASRVQASLLVCETLKHKTIMPLFLQTLKMKDLLGPVRERSILDGLQMDRPGREHSDCITIMNKCV